MKVLHLISSLDPAAGGVTQAVRTIISGLQPLGIENEVASEDSPNASFLESYFFPVYALGPSKTAWAYSKLLLPWLLSNIENYDALIVHGLWQYQTYAAYYAWKKIKSKKPKLFVMPHGMLDPYFQRAKGRKIKALRNWIFWKWNERNLINNADAVLFTCETEKILAREPFSPYHPNKESIVSLGVETPPTFNENMKIAFDKKLGNSLSKYWLFISRIHEKKGVDFLVQAYLQLKKEKPNIPPLVIAGPGLETSFGVAIQQLAEGNQIYFPGMLSGDAKWGAFYGSDVFILPSHQENFGIAVVEALACGKPVLISNQVNIWREIIKEKAGLAMDDNTEGVKKILLNWLNLTEDEKEILKSNSTEVFQNYFSVQKASNNIYKLLY